MSGKIFENMGYHVTYSRKSEGMFDLIAVNSNTVIFCQVKKGRWPYGKEMKNLIEFVIPDNCIKSIHRWKDGEDKPEVKIVP